MQCIRKFQKARQRILFPDGGMTAGYHLAVIIGAVLCAVVPSARATLSVTLDKIVEVGTQDFGDGLGTPVFAQGSVFYSKTDDSQSADAYGIYRDGALIVYWGDEISGNTVNNIGIADTDGSSLLIGAASNFAAENTNTYYATLNVSQGGTPTRILSRG